LQTTGTPAAPIASLTTRTLTTFQQRHRWISVRASKLLLKDFPIQVAEPDVNAGAAAEQEDTEQVRICYF